MTDIASTSDGWLTIPELVDILGIGPGKVHRLIEDKHLAGVRSEGVLRIPDSFLKDGEPLRELRGTLTLLFDAGFSDEEAVAWLLHADESLDTAPITALRQGRKAEVRRVAQALA